MSPTPGAETRPAFPLPERAFDMPKNRWKSSRARTLGCLAALLLSGSLGASCLAQTVTLDGRPGSVRVNSDSGAAVRAETAGGRLRWLIPCTKVEKAAPGMRELFKTVPGGLQLEVPLEARPVVSWEDGGLVLRWSTTENPVSPQAPGPAPSGDVFDSSKPPTYPLGPGDKLQVSVINVEGMSAEVVVDPAGIITLPVLDKVSVTDLTVPELQRKLGELLVQYVKEPQVSIQLLEYGSRYVNVLGAVQTPSRIPLKGALRVLDAVSQAGGFLEKSGDVEIQRRDAAGKLQSRTLSKEDLLSGSEKTNIYVLDQDVINVLPTKQIYVSGEVKTPGAIPYSKDMTLLRALTLAGGLTEWAKKDPVDILRQEKAGPKVIHVDMSRIEKGKAADVPLLPNDQVVVHERKFF